MLVKNIYIFNVLHRAKQKQEENSDCILKMQAGLLLKIENVFLAENEDFNRKFIVRFLGDQIF
jgi:hypothetical protein